MRPRVYIDTSDWWVGYYRSADHHYVCPLPTVVIRWPRRRRPASAGTLVMPASLQPGDELHMYIQTTAGANLTSPAGWTEDGPGHYVRRHRHDQHADALEEGRRLASQRDDLIADGVDPAALAIPLAPKRGQICPECEQGKHANCDGTAWNDRADDIDDCTCPDPTHKESAQS